MKINTLLTVLGLTLLSGSTAYSIQQFASEKKTQAQMQVLLDQQTSTIKHLLTHKSKKAVKYQYL